MCFRATALVCQEHLLSACMVLNGLVNRESWRPTAAPPRRYCHDSRSAKLLSTAGKQKGFSDPKGRGNIFFHILDYIEKQRPKMFILENVKGLVTLEGGKYLKAILAKLHSIGKPVQGVRGESEQTSLYSISHQVLNTKDHGISQSRARW